MRILKYVLKRLLHSILVLLGLSILVFIIARVVPGDPARMALGPRAPEGVVEKFREDLHLNDPIYVQYYHWIKGAVRGDFGYSILTKRSVTTDIKDFFPATLELMLPKGRRLDRLGHTRGRRVHHKMAAPDNTRLARSRVYYDVAPLEGLNGYFSGVNHVSRGLGDRDDGGEVPYRWVDRGCLKGHQGNGAECHRDQEGKKSFDRP